MTGCPARCVISQHDHEIPVGLGRHRWEDWIGDAPVARVGVHPELAIEESVITGISKSDTQN
jgi:hypothetical protein